MGQVKCNEITYRYVKIELLDGQASNVGVNLKMIYSYIDTHKNMGKKKPYGNAYKAIREKAQRLCGRSDVRFSKREVASLINDYGKPFCKKERYIKIPYKEDYIFRAIFELVDELKSQYPLPQEIQNFIGQIRRECFYKTQSSLYETWYKRNKKNQTTLNKHLLDDMFAADCTLNHKF